MLNSYSSSCISVVDFEFMEVNLFSDFQLSGNIKWIQENETLTVLYGLQK